MKVLSYTAISLAGLLSGAVVGAVGGFLLGYSIRLTRRVNAQYEPVTYRALPRMAAGAAYLGAFYMCQSSEKRRTANPVPRRLGRDRA